MNMLPRGLRNASTAYKKSFYLSKKIPLSTLKVIKHRKRVYSIKKRLYAFCKKIQSNLGVRNLYINGIPYPLEYNPTLESRH